MKRGVQTGYGPDYSNGSGVTRVKIFSTLPICILGARVGIWILYQAWSLPHNGHLYLFLGSEWPHYKSVSQTKLNIHAKSLQLNFTLRNYWQIFLPASLLLRANKTSSLANKFWVFWHYRNKIYHFIDKLATINFNGSRQIQKYLVQYTMLTLHNVKFW